MKREVKLIGLSQSHSVGTYTIVLSEILGHRKVPVMVRSHDAQMIVLRVENIKSPRPMTQDVIKSLSDGFSLDCQEIYIYQILEGVFYCRATFSDGIDDKNIDLSIGDAISMSLLYECPLYISEDVLSACGIRMEDDEIEFLSEEDESNSLSTPAPAKKIVSEKDLRDAMQQALDDENYELAAEIRDRLKSMEDGGKDPI